MAKIKDKPAKKIENILSEKHKGHANHICELARNREMMKIARLVKDSKYICVICGRTAAKPENLCMPVEM